jgi:hypothetical protein
MCKNRIEERESGKLMWKRCLKKGAARVSKSSNGSKMLGLKTVRAQGSWVSEMWASA